ncbi:MAG TPA: cation:proton antiporter [Terriglobales bacterium]|nr:cation:proton antiporter [Terriglobales bacterium]
MHNLDLFLTLAVAFIGAVSFGYFTHRLGWSPIVGYLLAGILVGPHTPGLVADRHTADQLAEVGVILLMFGVGLHFHLKDLIAVRRVAIGGAICQSTVATLLGALTARLFGWNWSAGIVFGLALSVASTVVLTRVLSDNGQLQSPTGRIAIGWLVVEDLFTVFVLVLLPVIFVAPTASTSSLPVSFALAALKLVIFIVFTLFAAGRVIPWILSKIAETHSRELFTLGVLAVALGVAVSSAYLFGVSMALGAFLAGMVVGQSEFSGRAGAEALPMRDAFAVMFFVSVGMLLDPYQLIESPLLIVATLAIVMIGKPLTTIIIVALLGYSSRIGLGVAIALSQIGEFSFLLGTLSIQVGALPPEAMNPLVAVAIVSIMLNPLLYRTLGGMESFLTRPPRLWRLLNRRAVAQGLAEFPEKRDMISPYLAVVVGYGPIGKTVTRLLRDRGIEPTIIEMNIDTHKSLRANGHRAVYGDANQREVLEQAGVGTAASFILSTSGTAGLSEGIRIARQINPRLHVVSRVDYLRHADALRKAGADEVFAGEGEVALAMTDSILRKLGATPEQLDEERARIRTDLFREPASES